MNNLFSNYLTKINHTDTNSQPFVYDCLQNRHSVLLLEGGDVMSFLQRMTTNNVASAKEKSIVGTLFANDKGRIIDSTYLVRFADKFLLICHKIYLEALTNWITKYTILDDVSFRETTDYFLWQTWNYVLSSQEQYLSLPQEKGAGNWIIGLTENVQEILESFKANDVMYCDEETYEYHRIQNGIPAAPNEINDTVNPHEVQLINHVDFDKGCYVGQEVIARLDTYDKVQKFLHIFKCANNNIENGCDVYNSDRKKVGVITSTFNLSSETVGLLLLRKKFMDSESFTLEDQTPIDIKKIS